MLSLYHFEGNWLKSYTIDNEFIEMFLYFQNDIKDSLQFKNYKYNFRRTKKKI